jgi:hypothetical protein
MKRRRNKNKETKGGRNGSKEMKGNKVKKRKG